VKKTCGLALVVWVLLVGAYGYVAWGRLHQLFPSIAIGVLGGTFAAMLVSSFIGLFTGGRDRGALRRAANAEPMRDGRLEAASGSIRAVERALEAPFSGQACVAYEYDVKQPLEGHSDFAGFALAPCAIQTLRGPARVFGYPMLDRFPPTTDDRIDRARGERYLSSATFEPLGLTSIVSQFSQLVSDDDGSVRKDLRVGNAPVSLANERIQERVLPEGTPVTILGYWSEARQGFVPTGAALVRIFPGDIQGVRAATGGDAVKTFGIAVAFFTILHAMLVPAYFLAPGGSASRSSTSGSTGVESVWDERDCDRQKTLLAAGADPNERGQDAITPLMNAARLDDPACVSNLIAAGAHLEDRDKRGDTALAQAITGERDDNAKVLLAAGAKDFRVTAATGQPIIMDSEPVTAVRGYIDAVYRGDFETMARLMAHVSVARLQDSKADLPSWQSMLPKEFSLVEGWMSDAAATMTIHGATKAGDRQVSFHVERRPDGWQIQKEWFHEIR
jgi:Ankyrin repeats (3 copies)